MFDICFFENSFFSFGVLQEVYFFFNTFSAMIMIVKDLMKMDFSFSTLKSCDFSATQSWWKILPLFHQRNGFDYQWVLFCFPYFSYVLVEIIQRKLREGLAASCGFLDFLLFFIWETLMMPFFTYRNSELMLWRMNINQFHWNWMCLCSTMNNLRLRVSIMKNRTIFFHCHFSSKPSLENCFNNYFHV